MLLSQRNKVYWLFFITLCISFASNIGQHHQLQGILMQLKWVFLLLLAISLVGQRVPRSFNWNLPGYTHVLLMIFFILSFLFSLQSVDVEYSFALLTAFAISVWVALALAKYLLSTESQNNFLDAIAILTRVLVFSSMAMYVLGVDWGRAVDTRFSGWIDNPNTLAMMLSIGFPIVLLRAIEIPKNSFFSDRVLLLSMIFLLLATGTRGALLSMLISSLIVVGMRFKWKLMWFVCIAFGATALSVGIFEILHSLGDTFDSFQRPEAAVLGGREEVWDLGLMLFNERPWVGYGYGMEKILIENFSYYFVEHQGNNFHGSFLSLLVHVGVLGAFPMILFLLITLKRLLSALLSGLEVNSRDSFFVSLVAIVASGLVYGFYETWMFSPGNMNFMIFWTAVFLLMGYEQKHAFNQRE